jgi:hypothetical protein
VFVGFSRIFLLEILVFKGLTARRLYKPFDLPPLNAVNKEWRYFGVGQYLQWQQS